jgi:phage minor structural protein
MAVPQIYDKNMKRLAYLDNAISAGFSLELNSIWTAKFSMPADDKKNQYCVPLHYVEIYDGDERVDLFRIIGEDLERSDGAKRFYNCEHVLATLLNDVLFQYHQYGGTGVKTAAVLNYILSRQTTQNWKLGNCDFERYFEYNWENTNLLAAVFAVPECFDSDYVWSWDTTVYPWTLSLVAPSDALKSEIRYAKNMTTIKKTQDATSIANRIYALGYGEGVNQLTIAAENNGVPYVEDALSIESYGLCSTILVDTRFEVAENLKAYAEQMLSTLKDPYVSYEIGAVDLHRLTGDAFGRFRPGEIVRVVDEADGVNIRTRIVSVEKDDSQGDPGSVSVTLANKTQDIAGSISNLQNRALISETYAQGATNQQIYNFADNADATHPATLKLFISDSVVRINKMLLNIEFEAFRAFEKAIGGGGGQTTSSGGGSTTSAGGGSTTSAGGGSTTSAGGGQTSGGTALQSSNVLPSQTNGQAVHNHGIDTQGYHIALVDSSLKLVAYTDFVASGAHTHPEHTHTISEHTHTVQDHTHSVPAHTHNVPAHTHTVQNHTHEIEFGIYEGNTASAATIKVDGAEIPAPEQYSDIDIVDYLSKDDNGKIRRNTWHTIEILPNSMSRIVGAVFSQTFCNSRGGGDY